MNEKQAPAATPVGARSPFARREIKGSGVSQKATTVVGALVCLTLAGGLSGYTRHVPGPTPTPATSRTPTGPGFDPAAPTVDIPLETHTALADAGDTVAIDGWGTAHVVPENTIPDYRPEDPYRTYSDAAVVVRLVTDHMPTGCR